MQIECNSNERGYVPFDNGVSDGDLALVQVVPDVEGDPLFVHGAGCRHRE